MPEGPIDLILDETFAPHLRMERVPRQAECVSLDLSPYSVHAPRAALGRRQCAEALLLLALGLRLVLRDLPAHHNVVWSDIHVSFLGARIRTLANG
jgi:hypothetical protein